MFIQEAVNASASPEHIEKFLSQAYASYQATLGTVLHCQVPTDRALRDFFSVTTPGVSASYAIGIALAAVVRAQVEAARTPQERRAILERVTFATASSDSVEDVLASLGVSWAKALEETVKLYR